MTDQVFNIKVETENGNYVGEGEPCFLLANYFADKKSLKKTKMDMLIF